jgi:hypothetical protein
MARTLVAMLAMVIPALVIAAIGKDFVAAASLDAYSLGILVGTGACLLSQLLWRLIVTELASPSSESSE